MANAENSGNRPSAGKPALWQLSPRRHCPTVSPTRKRAESCFMPRSKPPSTLPALGEAALCCPISQSRSLPLKTPKSPMFPVFRVPSDLKVSWTCGKFIFCATRGIKTFTRGDSFCHRGKRNLHQGRRAAPPVRAADPSGPYHGPLRSARRTGGWSLLRTPIRISKQ